MSEGKKMNAFTIRVLVADDHPGMIAGVRHELMTAKTIDLSGEARNSTELVALLETTTCEVVISDYSMPAGEHGDGIGLFSFVQRRFPHVKLVVLTMLDNPAILTSLARIGVRGVVSKSDALSHLVPAVHAAYTGGKYYSPTVAAIMESVELGTQNRQAETELSAREAEVVRLYAGGLRVTAIALRLNRSKKTISTQKARAMQKLGIERDMDLMKYALEHGWVTSSQANANIVQAQDAPETPHSH
jgi:two-component system capsular synthesis response regulator RcsB